MALGTTWFNVTQSYVWWMSRSVSPSTWVWAQSRLVLLGVLCGGCWGRCLPVHGSLHCFQPEWVSGITVCQKKQIKVFSRRSNVKNWRHQNELVVVTWYLDIYYPFKRKGTGNQTTSHVFFTVRYTCLLRRRRVASCPCGRVVQKN